MEEKEIEGVKVRFSPKFISTLTAIVILITPVMGAATTNNSYKPGTFVKEVEEVEGATEGIYIVKDGDTKCHISEMICSHLRIEITSKYWPAIARRNPGRLRQGKKIYFPLDPAKLEEDLKNAKKGWFANYLNTHNVYPEVKDISLDSVVTLLADIYKDDNVCVDPDFAELYLKTTGLDQKYKLKEGKGLTNDEYFDITDYIPSVEELNNYKNANKPKTKTKKK